MKPKLTDGMGKKRLQWAKAYQHQDLKFWKSVSIPSYNVIFNIFLSCTSVSSNVWIKSQLHEIQINIFPFFSLLVSGLLRWGEHLWNHIEEISVCAQAPWWKIKSWLCCVNSKASNPSNDLVTHYRKKELGVCMWLRAPWSKTNIEMCCKIGCSLK